MLVLDCNHVRQLLDPGELAEALRSAFRSISDGSASAPPRVAALTPAGLLGTMPGYVPDIGFGAKLVTYFRDNHDRGMPGHQALIALFDSDDGRPLALMDGTHITGMRTAMCAAVAAQVLARPDSSTVAVLGTGVQAREHLDAFARVFPAASLRLAGRTPEHVRTVAAAYPQVELAGHFEEAVHGADVLCLCTDAQDPVIARSWLADGCHVSSVGSGAEVDSETVAAANVFVETRAAATQPFPAGSRELAGLDAESVTEVGEVLLGTRPGRRSPQELTLYKSMGHATEDVVAAAMVYRAALATGVGATLSL